MKTTDENVYRKVGRRYEPIGMLVSDHWLSDGVWIVRHKKYSKSTTRADYLTDCYGLIKAGDIAKLDLPKLGAMENYADVVAGTLQNEMGKNQTLMDVARKVVKDLFDHFENEKKTQEGK